jgi:hypothetical protein
MQRLHWSSLSCPNGSFGGSSAKMANGIVPSPGSRNCHLDWTTLPRPEASHDNLALAILIALLEVRCAAAVNAAGRTAVPQVRSEPISALCCDNFA